MKTTISVLVFLVCLCACETKTTNHITLAPRLSAEERLHLNLAAEALAFDRYHVAHGEQCAVIDQTKLQQPLRILCQQFDTQKCDMRVLYGFGELRDRTYSVSCEMYEQTWYTLAGFNEECVTLENSRIETPLRNVCKWTPKTVPNPASLCAMQIVYRGSVKLEYGIACDVFDQAKVAMETLHNDLHDNRIADVCVPTELNLFHEASENVCKFDINTDHMFTSLCTLRAGTRGHIVSEHPVSCDLFDLADATQI